MRIEDTDANRNVAEALQAFESAFAWLGFSYDEGPGKGGPYAPYVQSERQPRHREAAFQLLEQGRAYPCFCTKERLVELRSAQQSRGEAPHYDRLCSSISESAAKARMQSGEPFVVRLRVPDHGETVVHDLVRGNVVFENRALDDFVILKSDGTPTYNFAVVMDDHDMEITHVIRGEEHLSNTPKQLLVYDAFQWDPPFFAHIPMILSQDRAKLSKRHGATPLSEFIAEGYLGEAVVNYLMLLGWSPGGDEEIISLPEAEQRFSLEGVQKSAAVYDVQKLRWMNGQYLRRLPLEEVLERARPFLEARGLLTASSASDVAYAREVIRLLRERVSTLVELAQAAEYFFVPVKTYDPEGVRKYFSMPEVSERLSVLADRLERVEDWSVDALEHCYTELARELRVSRGELIHPTRLAVTGRTVGPGLFEILALLGRSNVVRRLRKAVEAAAAFTAG